MAASTSLLSIPNLNAKPHPPFQKWHVISHCTPHLSFKSLSNPSIRVPSLKLQCTAVQQVAVTESGETSSSPVTSSEVEEGNKRKLYVVNLPWNFSGPDIKKLFSECGTVKDVEIIKQKNGKSRGFAFITMASPEEAQAALKKFNSYELSGRAIRVEFAKKFRPPSPEGTNIPEGRHKVYVSNLAWKARSVNLKEFFATFNPVSARVVFQNSGRSAGYGFVGFSTIQEAEAAIAELNGKELMERPVQLKMSERVDNQSENAAEESEEKELMERPVQLKMSERVDNQSENAAEESEEKVTN